MKIQEATTGILAEVERKLDEMAALQAEMRTLVREADAARADPLDAEDCGFLRRCVLFERASDDTVAAARAAGVVRVLGAGDVLFEAGDACHSMFVVRDGVIEIQRVRVDDRPDTVCYLGESDVIGKVAVFAGGTHRSSGRAPEGAEVLEIDQAAFKRLLEGEPALAVEMCRTLARRLEGVASSLDDMSTRRRQLQGRLRYFDLATVVQSLVSADEHTGTLTVTGARGEEIGSISILHSSVISARSGELRGDAAFNELFVADLEHAAFSFTESDDEKGLAPPDDLAEVPDMTLLMNAARVKDECERAMRDRFEGGEAIVSRNPVAEAPDGGPPGALLVWRRLARQPRPVHDLVSKSDHGAHVVIEALVDLADAGKILVG